MDTSAHPGPLSAADPIWLRIVGIVLALICAFLSFLGTCHTAPLIGGGYTIVQGAISFFGSAVFLFLFAYLPIIAAAYGIAWLLRRRQRPTSMAGNCPHCRYEWSGNPSDICPECGVQSTSTERQQPGLLPITRRVLMPLLMGVVLGGMVAQVWLWADTAAFESESAAFCRVNGTGFFYRIRRWPSSNSGFYRNSPTEPIQDTG